MDYSSSGKTIQEAMLDAARRGSSGKFVPLQIQWGELIVQTADHIPCATHGRVRLELVRYPESPLQGVDLKLNGSFELPDGSRVAVLRTWADGKLEDAVGYPYRSNDGWLTAWNVCQTVLPSGQVRTDRFLGNAGFWVERISERDRIYHCSHGTASPPDFDSLTFRISIV